MPCSPINRKVSFQGTVLDDKQYPVQDAKVRAEPADTKAKARHVRYVKTDKKGHFLIERLPWGEYHVFAMKEEEGYPNTYFSFYSKDVFARVTLTAQAPAAVLSLTLGPKAGVITGSISDVITKKPVGTARFDLTRDGNSQYWISTSVSATYRILLPADANVAIQVTAPGYEDWYYPGTSDSSKSAPVRLIPDQKLNIEIKLQPKINAESSAMEKNGKNP